MTKELKWQGKDLNEYGVLREALEASQPGDVLLRYAYHSHRGELRLAEPVAFKKFTKHSPARILLADGSQYDLTGHPTKNLGGGSIRTFADGETLEALQAEVAEVEKRLEAERAAQKEKERREAESALAANEANLRNWKQTEVGAGILYLVDTVNSKGQLTTWVFTVEKVQDWMRGESGEYGVLEAVQMYATGWSVDRHFSQSVAHPFTISAKSKSARSFEELLKNLAIAEW